MKYFLSILCIVIVSSVGNAQSFEKKVAATACECLKKEKPAADSTVSNCISRSMLEVAIQDSTKKYLGVISTVEGIQRTHKKVRALLSKSCKENMIKQEED